MAERLYRKSADGSFETVTPEARGKAAAFDSWLAQGGRPFKVSGRFKKGPMKGMTYDEAKQAFERKWATSPDSVKEKYASRSKTDLAPSERPQPIEMPAKPKATKPKAAPAPAPAAPATPAAPLQTPAPAVGSDEARAMAIQQNPGGEQFQTATVGNYLDMEAAVGKQRSGYTAPPLADPAAVNPALESQFPGIQAQARAQATAPNPAMGKQFPGVQPPPTAAPAPLVPPQPAISSDQAQRIQDLQTDERMHAEGKINGGPTPVDKAPRTAAMNPLTGLPMGYRPGDAVPTGYQGAANASVARQTAADPRLQAGGPMIAGPLQKPLTGRVMTPQSIPSPAAATPMQSPALAQSGINRPRYADPNSVEGRAAAEMKRQAGINANPGTENPAGIQLGRRMPLDELNSRAANNPLGAPRAVRVQTPLTKPRIAFAR